MRIIGGKYRGRRIEPPKNFRARPTTDFAREALFNILNNKFDFEGLKVLDLFSGTGSISYEFASRGALVDLVEKDPFHISGIRKIIGEIKIENIRPIHIDVQAYLKTCSTHYDIIFADPPYQLKWLTDIPELVLASGILESDGLFILEHPRDLSFNSYNNFSEHRNYGGVNFSFFRLKQH